MKLLSTSQLKFLDQATIEQKPIPSLELMEKASAECAKWILNNIDKEKFIISNLWKKPLPSVPNGF